MKRVIAIAAVSVDGIIGIGDEIPWKIPEDMSHFRKQTTGNLVVVGYNTYKTLPPKAFESRTYLVIMGSNIELDAVNGSHVFTVENEIQTIDFIESCEYDTIYIAGGEMVYETMIDYCDEAIITWVNKSYPNGTKRFPIDNLFTNFDEISNSDWVISKSGMKYKICEYTKSWEI